MRYLLTVFLCATAQAEPRTTIDEFVDNRDCDSMGRHCTATLTVTCASGKELSFTIEKDRLERIDIDGLFNLITQRCGQ